MQLMTKVKMEMEQVVFWREKKNNIRLLDFFSIEMEFELFCVLVEREVYNPMNLISLKPSIYRWDG